MTRKKSMLNVEEIKAALTSQEDFLRPLVQKVVQDVLEAEMARATCGTIRLKLLKIGAVLLRNTRRVRLHLSSAYPYRELFHLVCQCLSTA
ncbi:MAG: transposase [Verrucomicrobia bacterium]|nr:transposase [Verrucomicrobiota bacterium]